MPEPVDARGISDARVRFLTADAVELGEVREAILTSWWRSRESGVPADRIEIPYDPDKPDEAWVQQVQPVLSRLGDQVEGQSISLILTDPSGSVVSQHTGDPDLGRYLERVNLLPGFSYGERFVGTNGIGTALEDGRPAHVFGHEHYAENLERLACAGVPIHHPISGRVVGAVDLTCWAKDASGLLVTLARSTAEQIRQALLTHASVRELELFHAYLQTCRRTGGIVLALNADVVMMNDHARQLLDPADQNVVVRHARQALSVTERSSNTVDLPSGSKARIHCRRVRGSPHEPSAGDVMHLEFVDVHDGNAWGSPAALPALLLGTVGSTPLWLRCCRDVEASFNASEWLALVGEPGVGKYTLASSVHQRNDQRRRLRTLDAADGPNSDTLADLEHELHQDPACAVVFRHIDQLDTGTANELAAVLGDLRREVGPDQLWVAVSLAPGTDTRAKLAAVMDQMPRTVQVPPLRYHIEDLPALVRSLLEKLSHGSGLDLDCSPGAMTLLTRSTWPGNIEQLYQVLKQITRHRRRSGTIQPEDLPPEYLTVNRRTLNQLESMERDAIVDSLRDANGNKTRAAESLGMSRATIYRRIRDYGIVTPNPVS
ncbi:MAG: Fis family transcriptional regulator [Actinomycetia bacterium]|nr:Fis family transcriptional regulator [Actinomycetes bacterium]